MVTSNAGIRGLIPAASLKWGGRAESGARPPGHPRVNPRGLIEVPAGVIGPNRTRSGIRGLIPAASLKCGADPLTNAEAQAGIRGLIPAASLK